MYKRQDVDRLTMSCIMEIDSKGNILSYDIFKSVIHSAARMTLSLIHIYTVRLPGNGNALEFQYNKSGIPTMARHTLACMLLCLPPIPVSYTHLDVYKRQVFGKPEDKPYPDKGYSQSPH